MFRTAGAVMAALVWAVRSGSDGRATSHTRISPSEEAETMYLRAVVFGYRECPPTTMA